MVSGHLSISLRLRKKETAWFYPIRTSVIWLRPLFGSCPLNVSAPQSTNGNGTQARQRMNTPPRKKELEGELLPGGGVATCPRTRSRSSRSGCTTIGTTRIQATPKSWLWQRRPASLCCRSVSKMSLYCTLLLLFRHMQCLATDLGGWLQLEKLKAAPIIPSPASLLPRFATGSSTHGAASCQRSSGGRGTTHRGSPSAGEERSQDQAAPRWPR